MRWLVVGFIGFSLWMGVQIFKDIRLSETQRIQQQVIEDTTRNRQLDEIHRQQLRMNDATKQLCLARGGVPIYKYGTTLDDPWIERCDFPVVVGK